MIAPPSPRAHRTAVIGGALSATTTGPTADLRRRPLRDEEWQEPCGPST